MNLKQIKLVLVEPRGEVNVGSVARLCNNFGINELRIVSPRCEINSLEASRMAVKGKDLLKKATIYHSLLDAISDCTRIIATCGRINHGEIPLHTDTEVAEWISESSSETSIALVFGREDKGLKNQELLLAQKVISLSISEENPSLNLSHAVAIILYQIKNFKKSNFKEKRSLKNDPCPPSELDSFLKDAQDLLLDTGFLIEHTASARMNKLKSFFLRSEIRKKEVALMRGIIRQFRWALKK